MVANNFKLGNKLAKSPARAAVLGLRAAAGLVAVAVIAMTGGLLPFVNVRLAAVPAFLPIFATAVLLLDGLTAMLTVTQAVATDDAFLGGVAGAYGFVAIIAPAQLMVFPGVFSPTGLFGASVQSAGFLWVCWHFGFSILMIVALVARELGRRVVSPAARAVLARRIAALGPLLALACVVLAIWGQKLLPGLITNGGALDLRNGYLTFEMIVTGLAALIGMAVFTKLEHRLTLCVAIALLSNLGNSVIAAAGPLRYTLGWYLGRVLSMISSSVVFSALLHEIVELYLQQRRLNVILEARVVQDGLTGVNNKAFFIDQFPRELMRAHNERAPLALLMIDIDHFKGFNDTFGHVAGDVCLKRIADVISATVRRPGDFVVRFGGEEFAVVLPNTDSDGACNQAEAVRRAVRDMAIPAGEPGRVVTISVGAAVFDGVGGADPKQYKALLEAADRALYAAKAAGRNCWRFADWLDQEASMIDPEDGVLWQFAQKLGG